MILLDPAEWHWPDGSDGDDSDGDDSDGDWPQCEICLVLAAAAPST